MIPMDEADRLSEEALAHVEERIDRIYGQAAAEIGEKAAAHYRDQER